MNSYKITKYKIFHNFLNKNDTNIKLYQNTNIDKTKTDENKNKWYGLIFLSMTPYIYSFNFCNSHDNFEHMVG